MVQDTGLGQEMFVAAYDRFEDNRKQTVCYRYTDDAIDVEEHLGQNGVPNEYLGERSIMYCVSPPGESRWVKDHHDHSDLSTVMDRMQLKDGNEGVVARKYPLPGEPHLPVIVKFYNATENVTVGQLIQVVGVLGNPVEPEPVMEGFDSPLAPFTGMPVMHAITYWPLSDHLKSPFNASDLADMPPQARDIRPQLIDHIATAFGGDKLVAEFILLQLLAKVTAKNRGVKIGQLTLNVANFCQSQDQESKKESSALEFTNPASRRVFSLISNLVLHAVPLPLSLEVLNKVIFRPKSVNESLQAGVLQLVDGTTLVVDETVLSEGTLGDNGVRNIQALNNVIVSQTLAYEFPYSQFDFDTDLGIIVLSSTKSMLPSHCVVPLEAAYPLAEANEDDFGAVSKDTLRLFRTFIQAAKTLDYEIPEHVSEYIQDAFVQNRKAATTEGRKLLSQEDLMLRMNLARLIAVSFGETSLTKEIYDHATKLDEARLARLESQQQVVGK
ncbi:putative alanine racemase-domain-containing protein [Radiomyces spectabilis]|uniref:putative alanine racemase-domain-containing protein n=1 Tax=Radiomyces spectabilis TaxID=64574 RepID=UPI0022201063|nr:putative alanine racemase-domain-containing protein [Radiomyces spectabilis]KAI8384705.1 putative alanine racemase-domain-containing protein [Radiomyces spectabilis]